MGQFSHRFQVIPVKDTHDPLRLFFKLQVATQILRKRRFSFGLLRRKASKNGQLHATHGKISSSDTSMQKTSQVD